MRSHKNTSLRPNPRDYGAGFTLGINLALEAKKITFKTVNPIKAIISPCYLNSYIAGIRDGYRQGLWKYERKRHEARLHELSQLVKTPNKTRNRER